MKATPAASAASAKRVFVEVALLGRRWPHADRDVGVEHVLRMPIRLRINGDGTDAQTLQSADDAAGNFAAIGDQDGVEHDERR
jgi:hypothetical protein